jgi:hypothetical protein
VGCCFGVVGPEVNVRSWMLGSMRRSRVDWRPRCTEQETQQYGGDKTMAGNCSGAIELLCCDVGGRAVKDEDLMALRERYLYNF